MNSGQSMENKGSKQWIGLAYEVEKPKVIGVYINSPGGLES